MSSPSPLPDEPQAVAARYARRAVGDRYSLLQPDVWQTVQERQRAIVMLLARHGWFDLAEQLDPNGYDCMNLVGRHYLEKGDPAGARPWLERSLRLRRSDNPLATNYMRIANLELMRSATNFSSWGADVKKGGR